VPRVGRRASSRRSKPRPHWLGSVLVCRAAPRAVARRGAGAVRGLLRRQIAVFSLDLAPGLLLWRSPWGRWCAPPSPFFGKPGSKQGPIHLQKQQEQLLPELSSSPVQQLRKQRLRMSRSSGRYQASQAAVEAIGA
jgi:hypothetical protein